MCKVHPVAVGEIERQVLTVVHMSNNGHIANVVLLVHERPDLRIRQSFCYQPDL